MLFAREILDELRKNNKTKYDNINIPDEICDRKCTFNEKNKSHDRIKFIKEHSLKFSQLKKFGSTKKYQIFNRFEFEDICEYLKKIKLNLQF